MTLTAKSNAILSVDPGVELGWALWEVPTGKPTEMWSLISTGICKASGRLPWLERIKKTMWSFVLDIDGARISYKINKMYCEWPAFFDDTDGQVSASSGALVKLAFAVGQIAQIAHDRCIEFVPVPVAQWKGQVSKEVVIRRICRRLACKSDRFYTHEWDAVGIGLHSLGVKLGE